MTLQYGYTEKTNHYNNETEYDDIVNRQLMYMKTLSMENSPKFKALQALQPVRPFDGAPEDLLPFIEQIENIYANLSEVVRERFIILVLCKLTGPARRNIDYLSKVRQFSDIKEIIKHLRKEFLTIRNYYELQSVLLCLHMKPTEDSFQYINRCERTASDLVEFHDNIYNERFLEKIQSFLDNQVLQQFIRGLPSPLFHSVSRRSPKTLKDAFDIAKEEYNILQEVGRPDDQNFDNFSRRSRYNQFFHKSPHYYPSGEKYISESVQRYKKSGRRVRFNVSPRPYERDYYYSDDSSSSDYHSSSYNFQTGQNYQSPDRYYERTKIHVNHPQSPNLYNQNYNYNHYSRSPSPCQYDQHLTRNYSPKSLSEKQDTRVSSQNKEHNILSQNSNMSNVHLNTYEQNILQNLEDPEESLNTSRSVSQINTLNQSEILSRQVSSNLNKSKFSTVITTNMFLPKVCSTLLPITISLPQPDAMSVDNADTPIPRCNAPSNQEIITNNKESDKNFEQDSKKEFEGNFSNAQSLMPEPLDIHLNRCKEIDVLSKLSHDDTLNKVHNELEPSPLSETFQLKDSNILNNDLDADDLQSFNLKSTIRPELKDPEGSLNTNIQLSETNIFEETNISLRKTFSELNKLNNSNVTTMNMPVHKFHSTLLPTPAKQQQPDFTLLKNADDYILQSSLFSNTELIIPVKIITIINSEDFIQQSLNQISTRTEYFDDKIIPFKLFKFGKTFHDSLSCSALSKTPGNRNKISYKNISYKIREKFILPNKKKKKIDIYEYLSWRTYTFLNLYFSNTISKTADDLITSFIKSLRFSFLLLQFY